MLWSDDDHTQPQHHSGTPQSKPQHGCARNVLIAALIIIAVLLIKATMG